MCKHHSLCGPADTQSIWQGVAENGNLQMMQNGHGVLLTRPAYPRFSFPDLVIEQHLAPLAGPVSGRPVGFPT